MHMVEGIAVHVLHQHRGPSTQFYKAHNTARFSVLPGRHLCSPRSKDQTFLCESGPLTYIIGLVGLG